MHGAAGIAYAFLRGFRAGRRGDLVHARRWAEVAWDAREQPDACAGSHFGAPLGSIAYGSAGIAFVEAQVALAAGDRERREARIQQLVEWCAGPVRDPDYVFGAPGQLDALATLYGTLGEDAGHALCVVGDRLCDELGATPPESPSFAHGSAGVLHAVLRWSALRRRAVSPETIDAIDRLSAVAAFGDGVLDRAWCNGSPGMVLLLSRAYEEARRPEHLVAARRAGEHSASGGGAYDLCCGVAGRAYALLALDRVAPGEGWHDRARDLAIAAIEAATSPELGPVTHPNGLLKGHPGVVCLALDLLGGGGARFPLVEG